MAARTVEERIAIIDEKISKKKADIEALEAQKQKLLHPVTMKTVMEKAKASGLSPEEIAEKLGDAFSASAVYVYVGARYVSVLVSSRWI